MSGGATQIVLTCEAHGEIAGPIEYVDAGKCIRAHRHAGCTRTIRQVPVVRMGHAPTPPPASITTIGIDAFEQANGPWSRAIGAAVVAVRRAREAGWDLDKLQTNVRQQWELEDRLAAQRQATP